MEIVLYKSGVGHYYPVYDIGDLTNAESGYAGGLSNSMSGTSWAAKQGGAARPLDLPGNTSLFLDGTYKPLHGDYSIIFAHDSYAPFTWEFAFSAATGANITVVANNWGSQDTQSYVWFAVAHINMIQYFGFYVYNSEAGAWSFLYQPLVQDSLNMIWAGAEVEDTPGDIGYKPPAAHTDKFIPGVGGKASESGATPRYKGDPLTQPGAPDESVASAVGSAFINAYHIDKSNLSAVGSCLWGSDLAGFLANLYVNPLDFIVSLCVFPCAPNVGNTEAIKIGKYRCFAGTGGLGFDANGALLSSQFKVVSFGTVNVPENWGNFLDYSQTAVELYLPFIGSVNLEPSECIGGTVNVEYTIDFFTGMCVANVLCKKSAFVLPNGEVIANAETQHAFQGNCAIQIPLSRVDYGSMIGSLINACTQGITNPVAGFAGLASDAIAGGLRPNVSSKGNIVANSGFCSVLYPYIRLTRPITAEPESYQEVIGYPSYINTTLGECEGLCVCDEIDVEGITGATENELIRIKQLCREGVYI